MDYISNSTAVLLDMKEKHAGTFETRFARHRAEQAVESATQGASISIFTTVTITFLLMNFSFSFFTFNFKEFPNDDSGNTALPFAVTSEYAFGRLGVSSLLVIVALYVGFGREPFAETFLAWKKVEKSDEAKQAWANSR